MVQIVDLAGASDWGGIVLVFGFASLALCHGKSYSFSPYQARHIAIRAPASLKAST